MSCMKINLDELIYCATFWYHLLFICKLNVLQPSEETTKLKQTVASLKEEITTLQNEKDEYLAEITSLHTSLDQLKSDLAVKEAQTLHLENQLKGMLLVFYRNYCSWCHWYQSCKPPSRQYFWNHTKPALWNQRSDCLKLIVSFILGKNTCCPKLLSSICYFCLSSCGRIWMTELFV